MTVNDRIKRLVEHYSRGRDSEFARSIGVSPPTFGNYTKTNPTKASVELISKIIDTYQEVNPQWLILGKGDMIVKPLSISMVKDAVVPYGVDNQATTPYFDIDVTGGDFFQEIVGRTTPDGYIKAPGFEKCTLAVNARGDSMSPFINPGDIIGIQLIQDKRIIDWGAPHVIVTAERALIKYLRRDETNPHNWILRSHNTIYQDMEIPIASVLQVFVVKAVNKPLTY